MTQNIEFRTLKANEIEVRVNTINENGCSLLLYKDARADMSLLDETVGALNWQRKHEFKDGKLYCTVAIFNEEIGQWISKEDTGTESYTEKQKGEASDSFKRACVNWGIGRELYTAPFIWVNSKNLNMKPNGKSNKPTTNDKFAVIQIEYDENRVISKLVIKNITKNKVVFTLGENTEQQEEMQEQIMCDKCGKKVKAIKKADGTIVEPEKVKQGMFGMCYECWSEQNTKTQLEHELAGIELLGKQSTL